jgi:putative heme-binding domain-containing protein
VKRGDLERDKKQLLMNHSNAQVRQRSRRLFGSEVNSDRAKVVAQYQDVLELDGDVARGRTVFTKKCAVCHQVGDLGHQVAPNLSSVQNKSPADLLIAVLDPNREAQPNFNVYNVVTLQGRTLNGIIATESANSITLRRAEAKQDVILRSNIDELISTGVSLMPEGLEKDLTRQDVADVITFVKSIKPDNAKRQPK